MSISDLKPGDILLWWSDKMEIQIGGKLWSLPIPMPVSVHADIYIGNGKCRTSIQNVGSSTADVTKRQKQFPQKWVAVRMTDITPEKAVAQAKKFQCEYDWMGYYGQYADIFLSPKTWPIPDFSSTSDTWTDRLASTNTTIMYCSAFCAASYWPYEIAGKPWRLTSPQDIYDWAKKNMTKRKVIENF